MLCFQSKDELQICIHSIVEYLMDTLHQVVFIRFTGSHGFDCKKRNRELFYPAYRNLFLANAPTNIYIINQIIQIKYINCYATVVCKLGIYPRAYMLKN